MRSARFVVRGRVQGVGFRWFVQRAARDHSITGWVSNRPDGTVEVVASGSPEGMAFLETALKVGSRGSNVTSVESTAVEESITAEAFEIR